MSVAALPAVSLREALSYWLKLGFVSFGGPAGQISLMHSDLVDRLRWISERRFLHALNYVMVLPGPEAQQLATYIGWLMHGTWGGIVAGVLFVAPSLVVLCALSWIYLAFGDAPAVAGVLYGIKPAVTAIVIFAAYRIGSRTVRSAPLIVGRDRCVCRDGVLRCSFSDDRRCRSADRLRRRTMGSAVFSERRKQARSRCKSCWPGGARRRHAYARARAFQSRLDGCLRGAWAAALGGPARRANRRTSA